MSDGLTAAPMSWASISHDGKYRYELGRRWDSDLPECVFIMLNPSTADAGRDDPTIRRCIGFAKSLGCGSLLVGNLYAYRATDPRELWKASDPIGANNDHVLSELMQRGDFVIAGWGAHGRPQRVATVLQLPGAERLTAMATTKQGAPRHPLYLPAAAKPQPWSLGVH